MAGQDGHPTTSADPLEVSEQEAREELDRLLADKEFHCTERNRQFLRFVAEETFAGRGLSIKAYTVAVDVFGRPSTFDATADPIVRIEATRLRAALARYYEQCTPDAVRIELPKGRYIPVFFREKRNRDKLAPDDEACEPELAPNPVPSGNASRLNPRARVRWLASALGLLGGALLGFVLFYAARTTSAPPVVSQRPAVLLEFATDDGAAASEGSRIRDAIFVALSRFQTLRMISDEYTRSLATQAETPDYRLIIKHRDDSSGPSLWWQVIDTANGEAIETGKTQLSAKPPLDDASVEELAKRISLRLAGGTGVINTRILVKEIDKPTLGNGCILRAYKAMRSGAEKALTEAKACLEQTIAVQPSYVDAKGVLALLLVREENYDRPTLALDRALQMARDAAAIAPDSVNIAYARMTLEFLYGRVDLAIAAGRHAVEINPYNGAMTARLAEILYFTGKREEALSLARRASAADGVVYRDGELTLALDAYMQGSFAQALKHLERAGFETSYGPAMLKVATLGQMSSPSECKLASETLLAKWPQFEKTFHPMMTRLEAEPHLVQALAAGLRKAGLKIE